MKWDLVFSIILTLTGILVWDLTIVCVGLFLVFLCKLDAHKKEQETKEGDVYDIES